MVNKVGIIGCGKIFPRHLQAVNTNSNYKLIAICDNNQEKLQKAQSVSQAQVFIDYKKMVDEADINFVVIATPNSQHFEQAIYCLNNGCDVLIEKPATLDPTMIDVILEEAKKNNQEAYCVLQVRLNSCIQNLKYLLDNQIIGKVRSTTLTQRWQRPEEYFHDWRGVPSIGGGILHECGIHYLDVLCYLLGKPSVVSSKKYNTKHKNTQIEDTIYSIIDYGDFGGSIEVNISSEPSNLECSLSILTDKGYIKLGGKAMNVLEEISFASNDLELKVQKIMNHNNSIGSPNSYGSYSGSCPNHPTLYKKINKFKLQETRDVLFLIQEIYDCCNVRYSREKK